MQINIKIKVVFSFFLFLALSPFVSQFHFLYYSTILCTTPYPSNILHPIHFGTFFSCQQQVIMIKKLFPNFTKQLNKLTKKIKRIYKKFLKNFKSWCPKIYIKLTAMEQVFDFISQTRHSCLMSNCGSNIKVSIFSHFF